MPRAEGFLVSIDLRQAPESNLIPRGEKSLKNFPKFLKILKIFQGRKIESFWPFSGQKMISFFPIFDPKNGSKMSLHF